MRGGVLARPACAARWKPVQVTGDWPAPPPTQRSEGPYQRHEVFRGDRRCRASPRCTCAPCARQGNVSAHGGETMTVAPNCTQNRGTFGVRTVSRSSNEWSFAAHCRTMLRSQMSFKNKLLDLHPDHFWAMRNMGSHGPARGSRVGMGSALWGAPAWVSRRSSPRQGHAVRPVTFAALARDGTHGRPPAAGANARLGSRQPH